MKNKLEKNDYQVVHAISGRIRIKNSRLKRDTRYGKELQQLIKSLNAVTDVRISPATASIVVSYNPKSVEDKIIKTELANCIQQAGGLEICKNSPSVAALMPAPEATENDSVSPLVEKLEQNVANVLKTSSGIQIPEECLTQIDQFPVNIDQQQEVFEIGIPAFGILQPLNTELNKFAQENEKNTALQIISIDVEASFIEGGLLLDGKAKGKFREYLFMNPLTRKKYYTPWFSISAVGVAELDAMVVDETIHVDLTQLKITGKRGKWYKKLVEYVFKHFFKAKLVTKINEFLSNINGAKIQELFFQIKGDERLRTNSQELGLTSEKLDALLSLVQVNARVAADYLWLSVEL